MIALPKQISPWRLALAIWFAFATLYFIYGQYNHLRNVVARQSYEHGRLDEALEAIEKAQSCRPFIISAEGEDATVMNIDCEK